VLRDAKSKIILGILFVGFAVIMGMSLVDKSTQAPQNRPRDRNQESMLQRSKLASNENWKTYINEKYGFKFQYPESAIVYSPPGRDPLFSFTVVEFKTEDEYSLYNPANVSFSVHTKGSYQHHPEPNTDRSDGCEIYRRYTRTYGGREADIVEQAYCPGNEGSPGSGHVLTAVIPLSDTEDLVFDANLGNPLIKKNEFAEKILSTLTFIK
jgi:hypothetical protein